MVGACYLSKAVRQKKTVLMSLGCTVRFTIQYFVSDKLIGFHSLTSQLGE
jgi:hypothetical protein